MKTKVLYKQQQEKNLLENKNFRNNQNYITSKLDKADYILGNFYGKTIHIIPSLILVIFLMFWTTLFVAGSWYWVFILLFLYIFIIKIRWISIYSKYVINKLNKNNKKNVFITKPYSLNEGDRIFHNFDK